MVRRVLHIIREEAKKEVIEDSRPTASAPSMVEPQRVQVGRCHTEAGKWGRMHGGGEAGGTRGGDSDCE